MTYDPSKHHRRSIRLKGYDYTQVGVYFITACTWHRECLFGRIEDAKMHSNECGQIVAACWQDLPLHFENVTVDEFVLMPNHIHGLIAITEDVVGARHASPQRASPERASPQRASPQRASPPRGAISRSIGSIVGSFKSAATKRIDELHNTEGAPVWQRNYYEHIVRNNADLGRIRRYILNNPANWDADEENTNART